jgi:hypothetical protein
VAFMEPKAYVDCSPIPARDNSHTEVKVALRQHIESNWMNACPFKCG